MSPHYNVFLNPDLSYSFKTENGDVYTAYFITYPLTDADNNTHTIYYFSFVRNDSFECVNFQKKYDSKIRSTFIAIATMLFAKKDHTCIVYDCFSEDGFARHRSVVFRQWCRELPAHLEYYHKSIQYQGKKLYSSLIVVGENPLKALILDAYSKHLSQMSDDINS